ncbi:hypothetical protein [Trujillonella endophytica]|uniref:Uncharacterized protein n=1 Tax=Trujillonella endophytica TaxID=673521 RepID=A0A1H8VX54_9ACTN|nr:hypothetical protein [Trujillella endophytica]SEP20022.1 hypothetical protein SAMN05660991_03868 [Trujillella endophytica]
MATRPDLPRSPDLTWPRDPAWDVRPEDSLGTNAGRVDAVGEE